MTLKKTVESAAYHFAALALKAEAADRAMTEAHEIISELSDALHKLEGVTPIRAVTWITEHQHYAKPTTDTATK